MSGDRVYLFDTTLRDGAQTSGVDFSIADKIAISKALDDIGIDYIEGGWPGANPTDVEFFDDPPLFKNAKFTAFGMTKRSGYSAQNDPGLNALINASAPVTTLVGKCWDFHVDLALQISLAENLDLIEDSFRHCTNNKKEPIFDGEHFFDGYKANPTFALDCLRAAKRGGAKWLVLCDTNGGTLPHEIYKIVSEVKSALPDADLGIHCHNDTDNAVANSIEAVRAGVRQVQGTINGLGERCGNANILSVIANLRLKMGYDCGPLNENIHKLTPLSRMLDERLNRAPNRHLAFVGGSAFAHKGGLHVSAVNRDPRSYEHIEPNIVGNQRVIVVSDQAGRSNIIARLKQADIEIDDEKITDLLEKVKQLENRGYSYDGADASFELLALEAKGERPSLFHIERFRVIDERRVNARGEMITESEATLWVKRKDQAKLHVATGLGPVNAMDQAIREGIESFYPEIKDMRLVDYKVRILAPLKEEFGSDAVTRVTIESADDLGHRWVTVGVSDNIIAASVEALCDAIDYKLLKLSDG